MGTPLGPLQGYDLIPLRSGKRGKQPLHRNWSKKKYNNAQMVEHLGIGHNVGVRLGPLDLIVDVDPRNFKDFDSFDALCKICAMDRDKYPTVATGGGGLHLYMRLPEPLKCINELAEYPGVEYKGQGRQVVAPGSIHPDTNKVYAWLQNEAFEDFSFLGAPVAPLKLLNMIIRTRVDSQGEGSVTALELETMLASLNILDFQEHGDWLTLMQSCHHATNGSGCDEWVAFCISDPKYADASEQIFKRWDSLKGGSGGVTERTLYDIVCKKGNEGTVPQVSATDDFPDDADLAEIVNSLPEVAVKTNNNSDTAEVLEMNKEYCVVIDESEFVLFRLRKNLEGRPYWQRLKRQTFLFQFENLIRKKGRNKVTKAEMWLAHKDRRQYDGLVLDPQNLPQNKGCLNLWQGWAVAGKSGDWSGIKEHICEILCDGNAEAGEYVIKWIAYMLQKPWIMPGVAIAFRGAEGVGKSTLGRLLSTVAGQHGITITSAGLLAGRFNQHLRDSIFVFADEALWPGDKAAEGVLKSLVTSDWITYEAKGKDVVSGPNLAHLMMASNSDWIVPAGPTARRFFVSDVSDKHISDKPYFARLHKHIYEQRGLEAMVHALMQINLVGWHPSQSIPVTQALADQKELSMGPAMSFWKHLISSGTIDGIEGDWEKEYLYLQNDARDALVDNYAYYLKQHKYYYARPTRNAVAKAGRLVGLSDASKRIDGVTARVWRLPPLFEMRALFESANNVQGLVDW